jgi:4-hydroxy-tetrahydrodipicolinate reductase
MIRVCLMGLGKTGKEIARVLLEQKDLKLVAAVCSPESSKKGKDLGEIIGCGSTGIIIHGSDNLEEVIFKSKPDVVIDFSSPEATMKNAKIFSKMKVNIVIATTGFSNIALKKLLILTKKYHNGIVYAPNITLGVNVLMLLTNIASNILNNYDFQITEVHHKKKKDAPSGTAKKIAKEIEKGLKSSGTDLEETDIPITAIRAGGVIGKHEVMIIGEEDKIEITHESFSRRAFAEGAIRAVRYLHRKTGFYEMSDVLNLGKVLGDYAENVRSSAGKRFKKFASSTIEESGESLA